MVTNSWFQLGRDSSVVIPTRYGLVGPEIDSRLRRDFLHLPHRPWGPLSLVYNACRVFPGGKELSGRDLDHPSYLAPRLKQKYSYTSTPAVGVHGLLQGDL